MQEQCFCTNPIKRSHPLIAFHCPMLQLNVGSSTAPCGACAIPKFQFPFLFFFFFSFKIWIDFRSQFSTQYLSTLSIFRSNKTLAGTEIALWGYKMFCTVTHRLLAFEESEINPLSQQNKDIKIKLHKATQNQNLRHLVGFE